MDDRNTRSNRVELIMRNTLMSSIDMVVTFEAQLVQSSSAQHHFTQMTKQYIHVQILSSDGSCWVCHEYQFALHVGN